MSHPEEKREFTFTSDEIEELIEMVIEKYYAVNPYGRKRGLVEMFTIITKEEN